MSLGDASVTLTAVIPGRELAWYFALSFIATSVFLTLVALTTLGALVLPVPLAYYSDRLPRVALARDLNRGARRRGPPIEGVAAMTQAAEEPVLHILWMNGGLGCDGDSVALTAAT